MARLVLLNGAPGAGKSTIARLAGDLLPARVIDVDETQAHLMAEGLTHAVAKREARARAVSEVRDALAVGQSVLVTDFVLRPDFAEELASDAGDLGTAFSEIALIVPRAELARRLGTDPRAADAQRMSEALHEVLLARPWSGRVDASGTIEETLQRTLAQLTTPDDHG